VTKEHLSLWTCPDCGREFAKRNQWHSCGARSVDDHFEGKDTQLRELYDALISKLQRFGPVRVDAVQTSINLISKHHFGGITVQKSALRLGFIASEKIEASRIVRAQRLGPNKVGHSVKLHSLEDIDEELLDWLRWAYRHQS
jgi:hypothetical protein